MQNYSFFFSFYFMQRAILFKFAFFNTAMQDKKYDAIDIVAFIDRETYVKDFRDVATFEECCRACPNYGKRWGCPPFDHDTLNDLLPYERVMIVGVKVSPYDGKLPMEQVYDLIRPELERVNSRLLELERLTGGLAFGFVSKCPYCNGAPCARREGKPCRHPDVVRPSLEAYGFNVSLTASEVLGIDMVWGKDDKIPRYLTLVCGLFYNGPDLNW